MWATAMLLVLSVGARAAAAATPEAAVSLRLTVGGARVVDAEAVRRAVSSDPRIVEASIVGTSEVLLNARAPGEATVVLFLPRGRQQTYRVEVAAASSGAPMVSVDVQVLEIGESSVLEAGIDWQLLFRGSAEAAAAASGAASGAGAPVVAPKSPLNVVELNPSMVRWGQFARGGVDAILDFLITRGRAKLLAKPRLLTVSGGKARFNSGGQIPVPVAHPGARGEATIEWKQYGVLLEFEPKIESGENVRLAIRTEVSSVDRANAVAFSGGTIPAVRNRGAESTVLLPSGATVILAGLVQHDTAKVTVGVPVLSDIPLLGELFRHTEDRTSTSELVVFVTPTLVKP